jgi:uncharacterized membrane protein YqiK
MDKTNIAFIGLLVVLFLGQVFINEGFNTTKPAAASPACVFDAKKYEDANPDLKAAFKGDANALKNHYFNFGIKEGRSPCGAKPAAGSTAAASAAATAAATANAAKAKAAADAAKAANAAKENAAAAASFFFDAILYIYIYIYIIPKHLKLLYFY